VIELLIVACLVFLLLTLVLVYFMGHHQTQRTLSTTLAALENAKESERNLRTEIRELQNKMHYAVTDAVTHLAGWQLFEDRLSQSIQESERYHLTLGVLFVDIDDFRILNDGLGYVAGDELLQEVAARITACIRRVDSVSRFSKDTFTVLLTQLAKPETAAIVAQRILQSLSKPFHISGNELNITACIGIVIYPTDGHDSQTLLRNAEFALHLAKERGKHLYHFYQEKLDVKGKREFLLCSGLNRESLFNELVLYYQPVINIQNNTILCMDVLPYWQHVELGLIPGPELMSQAEKQRRLNSLSQWLLRKAAQQFMSWQNNSNSPTLLGIPLSIKQLENSHFIYSLSQIMQELKFKPEWLLLEIKGDPNQLEMSMLEKAFNMLLFMGVKIAIDHFGIGTFPLNLLQSFTVHYLRLDASVIANLGANERAVALVKSLVFLAKEMSMQLMVPGVDSDQQLEMLKQLGCCLMQGSLLGAPLTDAEVAEKLAPTVIG